MAAPLPPSLLGDRIRLSRDLRGSGPAMTGAYPRRSSGERMTGGTCSREPQVKKLLGIPPGVITCATVPIGYPARPLPSKLTRVPVHELAYADQYGERLFSI